MRRIIPVLSLLIFASLITSCASSRSKRDNVEKVIGTARSYIGTPYQYGGMSRSGMDCSGLLVTSFKSAGLALPRTSKDQSKIGHEVSIREIQKGDLVFFAAGRNRWKITHVGMVTEVRNRQDIRFIHASSSKGVIEANLMSNYYQKIFRKARRPKWK